MLDVCVFDVTRLIKPAGYFCVQKAHFKSDWHRYNLKQQLKGAKSVTEDQFETITGTEREREQYRIYIMTKHKFILTLVFSILPLCLPLYC